MIIGIVCAAGVDYKRCIHVIEKQLSAIGILTTVLQLSTLMESLAVNYSIPFTSPSPNELSRIREKMRLGNELRRATGREDIVTLGAIAKINQSRDRVGTEQLPLVSRAHIIATLKRPEEVETLRRIYGPGFYLMGVFDSWAGRLKNLKDVLGVRETDARKLMKDDEDDKELGGQLTRDTYHQADVFVSLVQDAYLAQIPRFIEIIFSNPFHTPTRDELAMSVAHVCALRSAQQGRQVGAVVVSEKGGVIGTGCNDVPKLGGGLYWADDVPDKRDHQIGFDSNDERKALILSDLFKRFEIQSPDAERLKEILKGSSFSEITEFGRAVHAEMEAILSCGRQGESTIGATLYTTTFPCHNCVRHIICSGIARVVYVEPYPKSFAFDLHSDAIAPEGSENVESSTTQNVVRMPLEPFVGIAPRRYQELFSLKPPYGEELVRKRHGKIQMWGEDKAKLRVPMHPISYLQREQLAVRSLQLAKVTSRQANEPKNPDRRSNRTRSIPEQH
jgi:deoxycytidylate deaminase